MKTQTSTPTLSSGRARAERCKELEEEKESNATEYGARDSQEVETEPKTHQSNRPKGRRRMEGDRRGSPAQGPGTKTEAGNRPGEQDRASPDLHRHHKPGRRKRGPKEPQSRSRSERKRNATPQYQDDSKYFTKKTRSDSTSATDPRDTPPTVA